MPRFVFALEPLLEVRRRAEQDAQRHVARIERERLRLEETLRRHQHGITERKHALRKSLTGTIDMPALRLRANASLHLVRQARQVVLQLAGVHARLESARARLVEAAQRRRAIELLRDRRYAQWKAAQDKAETAALDELAVIACARKEARP
ncbi:MAG: flagellar export protein FliJ [Planctomycetota bacterium]|jgi:flagellar export protein FliJ